jgi:hypothetical protein
MARAEIIQELRGLGDEAQAWILKYLVNESLLMCDADVRHMVWKAFTRSLVVCPESDFRRFIRCLLPKALTHGATHQIYPDGLGGFKDRDQLTKLQVMVEDYLAIRP